MKLVVQRSGPARVVAVRSRHGDPIAHEESIHRGLVVLACAEVGDEPPVFAWAAGKIARLRIFEDPDGKMNRAVAEIGGAVLVVSQFTLAGDASKGNRPSFIRAAPPDIAEPLVEALARALETEHGLRVARGVFGAEMRLELVNDGPVTILIER